MPAPFAGQQTRGSTRIGLLLPGACAVLTHLVRRLRLIHLTQIAWFAVAVLAVSLGGVWLAGRFAGSTYAASEDILVTFGRLGAYPPPGARPQDLRPVANLLARVANSARVAALADKPGRLNGAYIAEPLDVGPFIRVTGYAPNKAGAIRIAAQVSEAFVNSVKGSQTDANVPAARRLTLALVEAPSTLKPTAVSGTPSLARTV